MALTGGMGPATAAILLWILGVLLDLMSLCGKPKRDFVGVAGVGVCERARVAGRCEEVGEGEMDVALREGAPCAQPGTNRKLECECEQELVNSGER